MEDSAGATFFAAALSANTSSRSAGSTSDLRHPQVVLPADPTASAKKLSGTATPTPNAGAGGAQVRGRSFDTDVAGSMSGSAAPVKGDRTGLLGKASAGFLREMHAGTGGTNSAAPSGAATPAYPFAPLSRANSTLPQSAAEAEAQSTEYLLARSEELILEMERLFSPAAETTATASMSALMHKAEHLSAAALGNNNTHPRERVAEESILRQGSSQVSAKILANASSGKASVSWGGVQENENPGSARYVLLN